MCICCIRSVWAVAAEHVPAVSNDSAMFLLLSVARVGSSMSGCVSRCAGILLSIPQTASEIPQMTSQVLTPFGRNLLQFINLINIDREFADEVLTKEAIRLLGDLCKVPGLGPEIADNTNKQWISEFISNASEVPAGALLSCRACTCTVPPRVLCLNTFAVTKRRGSCHVQAETCASRNMCKQKHVQAETRA